MRQETIIKAITLLKANYQNAFKDYNKEDIAFQYSKVLG